MKSQKPRKRLPVNPSLKHLQKQAKRIAKQNPSLKLAETQHQIARNYGCKNWTELTRVVEVFTDHELETIEGFELDRLGEWITNFLLGIIELFCVGRQKKQEMVEATTSKRGAVLLREGLHCRLPLMRNNARVHAHDRRLVSSF